MKLLTALAIALVLTPMPAAADSQFALPNPNLTPGLAATRDASQVCSKSYARSHRPARDEAWRALVRTVRRQYAIRYGTYREYVIDHLVPLELGGAGEDARNVWPEPIDDSHLKDRVEDALHRAVCEGHLPLAQAQNEIARDWRHTSVGDPGRLPHSYFEDRQ